jgi:hypothetical protein
MAKIDLGDIKLDSLFEELKGEAARRAGDLMGEGRAQARRASGGHDDGALFSAFTVGILLGALAGAAIALLVAPFSGAEARRTLSRRVEEMRGSDERASAWETSSTGNGKPASPSYSSTP